MVLKDGEEEIMWKAHVKYLGVLIDSHKKSTAPSVKKRKHYTGYGAQTNAVQVAYQIRIQVTWNVVGKKI